MNVEGRCHCGAITYRARIDPSKVTICHCADCQMLTGSAFRANVPVPADAFMLLSGSPKTYVKTADSGTRRAHSFCPECGTPIHSAAEFDPPSYSLRIGCLAQRHLLAPAKQQWCDSALPWAMDLSATPRLARQ